MPARTAKPLATGTSPSARYPLLTAEQVMEMLGVSRTALWMLMRNQGLPYIKLGEGRRAALRFASDSVSQWLAAREQHTSLSA
jgi:predicted DNA-binding transcriptional regulator AlpA